MHVPLLVMTALLIVGGAIVKWYGKAMHWDISLMWLDLVSSGLLGFGITLILLPFFLFTWLMGSYERYIWIISGPKPFSMFGSGPFQLAATTLLVLTGYGLIALGLAIRLRILRPPHS
ncbi:MAG: hypothetical protein M1299_05170 [Firmicutes bacterium]|nr:hypothetical protein [Bacillota bacterium]